MNKTYQFNFCVKGEIMAGETINFAVTVTGTVPPPLQIVDAEGNVLTDGENVSLPDLAVGTAANEVLFTVSGGQAPYNFSVSSGAVPDGTDLNSVVNQDTSETVTLEGTPTTAETSAFSIAISDSAGTTKTLSAKKKIS